MRCWTNIKGAWPSLLAFLLWAAPAAQAQFTYTTNNGGITITGYTGPGGSVNIPAAIYGLAVTGIGDEAFFDTSVTSVTIPGSVTSIGNGVFSYCGWLKSIMVDAQNSDYRSESGVLFDKAQTTLFQFPEAQGGVYAIPDGVTTIAESAFYGCANLVSVTIHRVSPAWEWRPLEIAPA